MRILIGNEWWEVYDYTYDAKLLGEYIPSTYDYPEEYPDMKIYNLVLELDDVTPELKVGNWYEIKEAKFEVDDISYNFEYYLKVVRVVGNKYYIRDFEM